MMRRSVPQFWVKIQGPGGEYRVIPDGIESLEYQDAERKADQLKLKVNNDDLSNFDDPVWKKGGKLIVSWGYPGNMSIPRSAIIRSVKGFRTLTITAAAESMVMNTVTKTREFENMTRSEIVRQIASENGYAGEALHIDDTSERFEVIPQASITDAAMVARLASRQGFEFYVDFDGFHWHERRLGARPTRTITYYGDGLGEVLDGVSVSNDVTAKPGRVRVESRDPLTGETISEVADNDTDTNRETLTEIVEIIDPDSGASTNVERRVAQEETRSTPQNSQAAVQTEARARFRRAQQTAIKMTIPIIGDPGIFAKTVVKLEGFGKRLSVPVYVKLVKHVVDHNGYVTTLEVVSDGHGGHSTTSTRARGLSAIQVGKAPANRDGDVADALQAAVDRARRMSSGSQEERAAAITAAESALIEYRRNGRRSTPQIQEAMRGLARLGNRVGDEELSQSAASALGTLNQGQGDEVQSGGRQNRQGAPEDTGAVENGDTAPALEPIDVVDPDTGERRTIYREAGRGAESAPGGE